MKRLIAYTIIAASVLLAPVKRADVGKLQPIEVVLLDADGSAVYLYTDTEDSGQGSDPLSALADMKLGAERTVYLDTAQYLLVTDAGMEHISGLAPYLSDRVYLVSAKRDTDLKWAAMYLQVHGNYPTIKEWEKGKEVPKIPPQKNLKKVENNA